MPIIFCLTLCPFDRYYYIAKRINRFINIISDDFRLITLMKGERQYISRTINATIIAIEFVDCLIICESYTDFAIINVVEFSDSLNGAFNILND